MPTFFAINVGESSTLSRRPICWLRHLPHRKALQSRLPICIIGAYVPTVWHNKTLDQSKRWSLAPHLLLLIAPLLEQHRPSWAKRCKPWLIPNLVTPHGLMTDRGLSQLQSDAGTRLGIGERMVVMRQIVAALRSDCVELVIFQ